MATTKDEQQQQQLQQQQQQTKPKRLSMSEILEMTLAKGASKRSSVSLSRNASGETQIEVTVATGESDDVATIEDAERLAREVYHRLTAEYPPVHGHDGSALSLSRNAKGETQIEVTTRTADRDGRRSLDDITEAAYESYDTMRVRYPMANGTSAKPGSIAA